MEHIVSGIVAFAKAHALLAYGLAFLLAGAETFPVLGAAVPGTATIIALGALIPSGALGFWPLVIPTIAGAIAGDGLSYWLGHHYKLAVATIWPLRGRPALLDRGNAFFARHGSKAILFSRFTPGVRAVVPLAAGVTGMKTGRFYAMDMLAALLWGTSHVAMGALLGASLDVLGAIAGRLAALALAVLLVLAVLVWLTPRAVRLLADLTSRWRGPVSTWTEARDTWVRRKIRSLLDPDRPEIPGLIVLGALLIAGVWLFFGVLQDMIAGDPLARADLTVFLVLQSLRVTAIDRVMVAVSELGDANVIVPVALVALLWLTWHRAWRAAMYAFASLAGASLFALLLNLTLRRIGLASLHVGGNTLSFPSGHATASVALYGFLAILIGREAGMRLRIGVALAAVLLVAAIAFARLYLGAQWLADVLAGFAFGLAWIALLGIAYLQHRPRPVRATGLASVVGVTLIAGGVHMGLAHQVDMQRYTVRQPIRQMALQNWQQGGWADLPVRRLDLFGEYEEPFTVQWVGSLANLKAQLSAHGWAAPTPWTLRSAVEWLSPHADPASLPVLPRLDNGRAENLVMIKTGPPLPANQRLVLRLWFSETVLTDGLQRLPLWIGTVATEQLVHVAPLATIVSEGRDMNAPLRLLHHALPATRIIHRQEVGGDGQRSVDALLGRS
jgi:undecaprenyl-diphosphatase